MDDWQVDVAVLSSQKALALPPGLAFVAMNHRGLARLAERTPRSLYFNLKDYLADQQRGQLPYTPAIGLMLQLHQRLLDIQQQTLPALVAQHKERAASFRLGLEGIAFDVFPFRSSNAMTALSCKGIDAFRVVEELRRRYNIVVAPNAGPLKSHIFRIAHMGAQEDADLTSLTKALKNIAAASTQTVTERTRI
jgi:aspartate aminotransferase-like enzyme